MSQFEPIQTQSIPISNKSLFNNQYFSTIGQLCRSKTDSFFRYFVDVAEYLDEALMNGGKAFVNCVFGLSRSTTCIVAYLMLAKGLGALQALQLIRQKRPVKINPGFLQQVVDLEHQLEVCGNETSGLSNYGQVLD